MNQFELRDRFPTEKAIIKEYIRHRYGFYVTCNHCKSKRVVQLKNRPKFYQCNGCNKTFSIFKGTIFEKTRVSLLKWMLAINFVCNNKKSLPALQFQREIGGDYRTSWRMLHQIRKAMSRKANKEIFELIVEVDETYVGGKPRKGARKRSKRGRGTDKTPVVGILERDSGKVHAVVAPQNKSGRKLTGKQLLNIINESVSKDAVVVTDEFRSYRKLNENRIHLVVDHSKEFAKGFVHTNGIEGFWSLLKRGIVGSYHKVSVKYLQHYVDEFTFRYSNRKNEAIFDTILKNCVIG